MSTIAGDLVTTTASTATSINYAGQSQLVADGKLDVAETGQTGDYHLEDRSRYRIQDTESIQSLWANDAWTETGHSFSVDHEAHEFWVYNQTVNLPKNSDPIITDNGDGTFTSSVVQLGQDQAAITSAGGYDYHLTQSGTPKDFLFSLNHTSQSQSGKQDTGTWRAADGTSGATYDNLGNETKNSRADLAGRVQNGTVYYTGIDVYQTKNTSTNNAGSGFALGSTTNSHTVGSTQTIELRGGNSGSWYGSKMESGNSTTNYTTVSGTMGQPFSGMTQTGFNTTTMYGTAAQTGISGAYGALQTGGTVTPGPVILPPLPGGPNYQNPGGYVTPVSGKINFGDPSTLFPGLDPRNPGSCLYDPRMQPFWESNPLTVLSVEERVRLAESEKRFENRLLAIFGIIGAVGEINLGVSLILSSEFTFGLSIPPGVIAVVHGGSRGENQLYQLWTGETGSNSFEKIVGREVDIVITVGADSVNIARSLAALGQSGINKCNYYDNLRAVFKNSPIRVGKTEISNALSDLGKNAFLRNLNQLDEFGSGAGFSGVIDVESGKFLAYASGETKLANGAVPLNLVEQFAGHQQVNGALSGVLVKTSPNRLGFSMVLDAQGNFAVRFNSLINSANPNVLARTVPESMRQQILDAISKSTSRKAYSAQ